MSTEGARPVTITDAGFPDDAAIVRTLLREYAAALPVDLDFQDFEAEVATLPGKYARPQGRLLLARRDGRVLGCIGMRPLAGNDCEMKRLYVRPGARGLNLGRLLVERLLDEARNAGYTRMFLDTLPTMETAQRLYAQLGFEETEAYVFNPVAGTKYMVRMLE